MSTPPTPPQARVFDRIPRFDERSRNYGIRGLVTTAVALPARRVWTPDPYVVDQGAEGSCVGMAMTGELGCTPVRIPGLREPYAHGIYRRAQQIDQWPGERYSGTSVLAGAKTLVERGYLREYRWAFSVSELILGLLRTGPAVLGVEWYDTAYETRPSGLVDLSGQPVGGHAILAYGYVPDLVLEGKAEEVILLRNSWGRSWGIDGTGYVRVADMDAWLRRQGEAMIPSRRSYGPTTTEAA